MRFRRLQVLLAALALLAAACGDDSDQSAVTDSTMADSTQQEVPEPEVPEPEAPEPEAPATDTDTDAVASTPDDDQGGAEGPAQIDEITWALSHVPNRLFQPYDWNTATGSVLALVHDGLLVLDQQDGVVGAAAESFEQVDEVTYVYNLRDGVTFHDGSPVTADDVAYSMSWHLQEQAGSPLGTYYDSVESIEVTSDDEVTVTLTEPSIKFRYTPAHAGHILKRDQLENRLDALGSPDELPLGTGPYRVVEFVPGESVVLERYPGYWGEAPAVQRINIVAIPDAQTRMLAMRNGEIDGTFDIPIGDVDQWQSLDGVDVLTSSANVVVLITMDYETPPFDDVHVRRAFAHSLDREGLVAASLQGNGEAARTLNPPGMWAGVLNPDEARAFYSTLRQYEFDLDKAAAELAQSSVPDGFEVSMRVADYLLNSVNAVLNLQENLKQIGVTLNVEQVDGTTWITEYVAHENLGVQHMEWYPDYPDPASYPAVFFGSSNAVKDGFNASNFRNDRVDELLATANASTDPAVRADALMEMFEITNEEVAVLPVLFPDAAIAISSDLAIDVYMPFWYTTPWTIRARGDG